jgi:hypothetical protein
MMVAHGVCLPKIAAMFEGLIVDVTLIFTVCKEQLARMVFVPRVSSD